MEDKSSLLKFSENEHSESYLKKSRHVMDNLDVTKRFIEQILHNLSSQDDVTALEIGCGLGTLLAKLIDLHKKGNKFHITGIDFNQHMIECSQKTLSEFIPQFCTIKLGNIMVIDSLQDAIGRTKYNLIFSRFVFLYTFPLEEALQNILSRLRSGGTLILQEPDNLGTILKDIDDPIIQKTWEKFKIWFGQKVCPIPNVGKLLHSTLKKIDPHLVIQEEIFKFSLPIEVLNDAAPIFSFLKRYAIEFVSETTSVNTIIKNINETPNSLIFINHIISATKP